MAWAELGHLAWAQLHLSCSANVYWVQLLGSTCSEKSTRIVCKAATPVVTCGCMLDKHTWPAVSGTFVSSSK